LKRRRKDLMHVLRRPIEVAAISGHCNGQSHIQQRDLTSFITPFIGVVIFSRCKTFFAANICSFNSSKWACPLLSFSEI